MLIEKKNRDFCDKITMAKHCALYHLFVFINYYQYHIPLGNTLIFKVLSPNSECHRVDSAIEPVLA